MIHACEVALALSRLRVIEGCVVTIIPLEREHTDFADSCSLVVVDPELEKLGSQDPSVLQ